MQYSASPGGSSMASAVVVDASASTVKSDLPFAVSGAQLPELTKLCNVVMLEQFLDAGGSPNTMIPPAQIEYLCNQGFIARTEWWKWLSIVFGGCILASAAICPIVCIGVILILVRIVAGGIALFALSALYFCFLGFILWSVRNSFGKPQFVHNLLPEGWTLLHVVVYMRAHPSARVTMAPVGMQSRPMQAADYNGDNAIELLCHRGANVHAVNSNGLTPLALFYGVRQSLPQPFLLFCTVGWKNSPGPPLSVEMEQLLRGNVQV